MTQALHIERVFDAPRELVWKAFTDPDETLMLPSRIESVVIVRNSGSPRLRITQSFSDYRRFVTESRLVR